MLAQNHAAVEVDATSAHRGAPNLGHEWLGRAWMMVGRAAGRSLARLGWLRFFGVKGVLLRTALGDLFTYRAVRDLHQQMTHTDNDTTNKTRFAFF